MSRQAMTKVPERPKLYHITHVENLPAILEEGSLVCDRAIHERGGPAQGIGLSSIKQRRIQDCTVRSHPGTKVGDYVPFYWCPRSVMLYVIHRANHAELTYRGGQEPIVHLEADLHAVVRWADANHRRWAFSLSNAGAYYAEFRASLDALGELNWAAIASDDFRAGAVKEGKQAEFLIHESFPFGLVERIGVVSKEIRTEAEAVLGERSGSPKVEVLPEWYY